MKYYYFQSLFPKTIIESPPIVAIYGVYDHKP
ncbi:hypothetical protein QFZ80_002993 [Paenibacillus sp. V4I7]|nr:hypothetical protein [Paenibacillus sp. V4I7]MDQ0914845.1 hypothetical protein [Paenibacillus sp. V4I5]